MYTSGARVYSSSALPGGETCFLRLPWPQFSGCFSEPNISGLAPNWHHSFLPSGNLSWRKFWHAVTWLFFCFLQLPDVCYSWWVLASLKIIGRIHWIDKAKLRSFILACQDEETGGFADRPGDMVSSLLRDAMEGWNIVRAYVCGK